MQSSVLVLLGQYSLTRHYIDGCMPEGRCNLQCWSCWDSTVWQGITLMGACLREDATFSVGLVGTVQSDKGLHWRVHAWGKMQPSMLVLLGQYSLTRDYIDGCKPEGRCNLQCWSCWDSTVWQGITLMGACLEATCPPSLLWLAATLWRLYGYVVLSSAEVVESNGYWSAYGKWLLYDYLVLLINYIVCHLILGSQ